MEFAKIGSVQMTLLILITVLAFAVPLAIAIIWTVRKKERFTTVLVGAATFFLFVIVLEKPIQNVLVVPTQMGLPEHAAAAWIGARPLLMALILALFPGVFEETGRLIAFKTVLKNRKNRETSISHGIGHGGFEVMFLIGVSYLGYLSYAFMINSGTFGMVVEQVKALAPDQADQLILLARQMAELTAPSILLVMAERTFAVLFHIGASILVFYACRDRERFWLYPVAILLHTALDFVSALMYVDLIRIPVWLMEGVIVIFGIGTFCAAYFLLYRKDKPKPEAASPAV
ncbi:MAG: YhfC family intramembrane metalloprotease [Lachnospiraceae bacterium]|nr:YhfC family intramembrane metalloprotease [Lachnospiraceae bacterium]